MVTVQDSERGAVNYTVQDALGFEGDGSSKGRRANAQKAMQNNALGQSPHQSLSVKKKVNEKSLDFLLTFHLCKSIFFDWEVMQKSMKNVRKSQ